jgi:hypothetical protein
MTSDRQRRSRSHWASIAMVLLIGPFVVTEPARAATDGSYQNVFWVNSCAGYGNSAPAWTPTESGIGLATADSCGAGDGLLITARSPFQGSNAAWSAETPAANLRIIGVKTPSAPPGNPQADCKLGADGYTASYFWGDNGTNYGTMPITIDCHGLGYQVGTATAINEKIQPSRYLGFQATCSNGTKPPGELNPRCAVSSGGTILDVTGIALEVQETSGPSLIAAGANNLAYAPGWVRGVWPTTLVASDPSGVCEIQTAVNGTVLNSYSDPTPDQSQWSQCPASQLGSSVDTSAYPNGQRTLSLAFEAQNAAGATSSSSKAFDVDNEPVNLTLSGPADAPTTAGTQYVTATATAGPSGIGGIWCSTDGSPYSPAAGPSARVPVSGIGQHTVQCYARNNALDASGSTAVSPTRTWAMTIRQPSVSTVSFTRLVDALRCRHVKERVKLPAHWVTGHSHGKPVHVKLPAQTRTVKVVRCRPRFVTKRVTIGGHIYVERIVVRPHKVRRTTKAVPFGATTTIRGWVGTAQGIALAGQPVELLTAPDNGGDTFAQVAVAHTAANGTWTAKLPPGPSRVIRARYPGSTTVEPAIGTAKVRVPASIKLKIDPHSSHWGGTIRITGRLRGCCVPKTGELVELHVGWSGGSAEIGHVYARGGGRVRTKYTFLRGSGSQTYRFWATSVSESDYPYSPQASRRITVTVG